LSQPPYNHIVYQHENPCEFSIHNAKGWVDLYVQTNPEWEHHKKFPILGIETKIARNMGWLIDAIEQVDKYSTDLKNARYEIEGKQVPAPTIFLVVTPESWEEGFIYKWYPPEFQNTFSLDPLLKKYQEGQYFGSWFTMTFFYERLLMKHGASIIRRGSFFTNMFGNHGAVTRYGL
jgi:hypothetical protein